MQGEKAGRFYSTGTPCYIFMDDNQSYPTWNATLQYDKGDRVYIAGKNYESNFSNNINFCPTDKPKIETHSCSGIFKAVWKVI